MPELGIRRAGTSGTSTLEVAEGTLLAEALRQAGIDFAMPCGGQHTCGKCAAPVRGAFSPLTAEERALLAKVDRDPPPEGFTWRMACLCRVAGAGEVLLPGRDGRVSVAREDGQRYAYDGGLPDALGMAADIGTTTVSLLLYHLPTGERLASAHAMNRQAAFGADVLSRIAYSDSHGIAPLVDAIRGQLAGMASEALETAGVSMSRVSRMVIAGNTTMLHYLAGLDPHGIGVSPFTPESRFGEALPIANALPELGGEAELYLPPAISAYVGPDITAGILATRLCDKNEKNGTRLLVDVGTNGEMALYAGDRLYCCSTAAGPAFEGAGIAMGMPALPGAVDRVSFAPGEIACHTLENAPARGICGTGLISAVSGMLAAGMLEGGGRIREEGHPWAHWVERREGQCIVRLGESGVFLTQEDLRNIQLAKAAIAAGIDTLLHEAGIAAEAVEAFCLSGGFGSYIDAREAAGLGLMPQALVERATAGGNTSLRGAAELLFSLAARDEAAAIAGRAEEIQLSSHPWFMEQYIEHMAFFEE